jgi:hypothetical protein
VGALESWDAAVEVQLFAGEERRQGGGGTVVMVYHDCSTEPARIPCQTCASGVIVEDVFEDVGPDLRWEAEEACFSERICCHFDCELWAYAVLGSQRYWIASCIDTMLMILMVYGRRKGRVR